MVFSDHYDVGKCDDVKIPPNHIEKKHTSGEIKRAFRDRYETNNCDDIKASGEIDRASRNRYNTEESDDFKISSKIDRSIVDRYDTVKYGNVKTSCKINRASRDRYDSDIHSKISRQMAKVVVLERSEIATTRLNTPMSRQVTNSVERPVIATTRLYATIITTMRINAVMLGEIAKSRGR